jgi:hypothetical protein
MANGSNFGNMTPEEVTAAMNATPSGAKVRASRKKNKAKELTKGAISLSLADEYERGGLVFQSDSREVSITDASKSPRPIFRVASEGGYYSPSDALANKKHQYIEIYHIPTGKNVFFKSFLTSFKDTFQTNYNKETVFGRMDPIATYMSTGRTIELGWSVPSSGLAEAKENLAKANRLASMLYPVYDEAGGGATTMRSGPVFKMKMGNLIMKPGQGVTNGPAKTIGLPGIIGGFSYNPTLKDGVFDLANGELYPKTITISLNFTVLHDTPLGWVVDGDNAMLRQNAGDAPQDINNPQPGRFPYGGNNKPVADSTKSRAPLKVKQDGWESRMDLQLDLMRRRAEVRASRVTQAADDAFRLTSDPSFKL